jgi:DNA-binding CsgD family transcriptional regulator/tetratricopeptide (TPR) repeat protein
MAQLLDQFQQGIAVFFDDFHALTADLIDVILTAIKLSSTSVLMVGAGRQLSHVQASAIDRHWSADLSCVEIGLKGLNSVASSRLLQQLLEAPPLVSLSEVLEGWSLGNPLALSEAVKALRAEGGLIYIGGRVGLDPNFDLQRLGKLASTVNRRVRRIDASSLRIAEVLVVAGKPLAFEDIVSITGERSAVVLVRLEHLERDDIIVLEGEAPPKYRLAHGIFESAIAERMSGSRRSALHAALFDHLALHDEYASIAELAHHAVRANIVKAQVSELMKRAANEASSTGNDEDAAHWFSLLSDQLPRGSAEQLEALIGAAVATSRARPELALPLLGKALGRSISDEQKARLLAARGYALRLLGNFEAAIGDLNEAESIATGSLLHEIRHSIAVLHGIVGNVGRAEEILQELVASDLHPTLQGRIHATLGHIAFVRDDLADARDRWIVAMKSNLDVTTQALVSANLSWVLTLIGDWSGAERLIETTLDDSRRRRDIWTENTILCSAARLMAWTDKPEQALEFGRQALTTSSLFANPAVRATALDSAVVGLLAVGRAEEGAHLADELELLLATPNLEPRDWVVTCCVLGDLRLALEDTIGARRAINLATVRQRAGDPQRAVFLDHLRARLALLEGHPKETLRLLGRWLATPSPIAYEQSRLEATSRLVEGREALDRSTSSSRGRRPSHLPAGITRRELEIATLLAANLTDKEIATALSISWHTARKHVENVMRKLGVGRRNQVASAAKEAGLALGEIPTAAAKPH